MRIQSTFFILKFNEKWGLKVNFEKSEYMTSDGGCPIIGNKNMRNVVHF